MTNTLFPGRPDYTGPTAGWFGLLHHRKLCEYSHNVMERVNYVREYKPAHEKATRLHNMIYLGDCEAIIDLDALHNDYMAKRGAPHDDYMTKRRALSDPILAYIKEHIPDCAWNGRWLVCPPRQVKEKEGSPT